MGFSTLLPWSLLFWQLSTIWEINEQYSHGFIVPVIMIYLILKIPSLPVHDPTQNGSSKIDFYFVLGTLLILFLFPIWIIRSANPDWRLLNVVFFLTVLLFSFLCIYMDGGWEKTKHFFFPLLFFAVAIPWPLSTDLKLAQWLQTKVSSTIVDCLLLMEHKAILQGTVIDVGVFGKIGVDQACSGINGLQASMVVSLFFGAYYGLPVIHRVFLFLSGFVVALLMNLARAFTMSFIKVKGRGELLDSPVLSIGKWQAPNLHDLAGLIETIFILICILLISKIFTIGTIVSPISEKENNWNNLLIRSPLGLSLVTVIILVAAVISSEVHYAYKEKDMVNMPEIKVNLDEKDLLIEKQEIPRQVVAQLHFKEASSKQWQDKFRTIPHPYGLEPKINPNDQYWQAFQASWDSGGACTAVLSTHSPESCLPLTGLSQIAPLPGKNPLLIPIKVNEQEILFEAYEFSKNLRKLFVFRCFWPKKLMPNQPNLFPRGGYNFSGRIASAIEGRRNVGGTMLAIALANVDSQKKALSKLQNLANRRISFVY